MTQTNLAPSNLPLIDRFAQRLSSGLTAATPDGPAGQGDYQPLLWQEAPYHDTRHDQLPIVLLTGSAGGGKSRLAGQILHRFLAEAPQPATGLMLRKAREWASKSITPFMKQTVIKGAADYKKSDMTFEYPNGSLLYIGGMRDDDQREAVRSIGGDGGLDIVWFEEANAFTQEDFNEILGRMRGKANGYTQILLTTNPDAPNHWINQRLIIGGEATVYYSGAKDNPYNPPEYRDKLEMMTGTQYERLVLGRWVQAEGAIYDNFSVEHNVSEEADYNPAWMIRWGVDDGYAYGQGPGTSSYHPRVFLLGQITPQGGLHIFAEYYATGELPERSLQYLLNESEYPRPDAAYIDSSAVELKARLWEHDITTAGATHPVHEGIKNVRRLIADGQGMRLLRIHPRCTHLIRELQSYRYDDNSHVANIGEPKPLKVDDHGPDTLRYMTWDLRYND